MVVGASDTSVSFLETLIAKSHLRFNNLTLVSPHGLPVTHMMDDAVRDTFLSSSHAYTTRDLKQMSLQTWVDVTSARQGGGY